MKRAYLLAALFVGLSFVFIGLIILSGLALGIKIWYTQSVFVTVLHIGAAVLFVRALNGFQRRIKITYVLICASMLMIAIGLIQDIAVVSLGYGNSYYALAGGNLWPFVIMMFLAYFGVRLLAIQAGIESIFLRPWFTIGLAVVGGCAAILVPTPRTDYPVYIISIGTFVYALAILLVVVTILAIKIMHQVSVLYKSALRWVALYYGSVAVVTCSNVVAQIYLPHTHWFWTYGVSYTIYLFTAVAAVFTALAFTRIAYAEDAITRSAKHESKSQPSSSIDVIMSLAQLASNPRSIGPALDGLRVLTASLDPNEAVHSLSGAQQATTADIYQQLESFLVNQEPIRKFTRQQLRQMVDIRFRDSVQEPVFWQKLTAI